MVNAGFGGERGRKSPMGSVWPWGALRPVSNTQRPVPPPRLSRVRSERLPPGA
jgi:hypothetical protein